MAVSHLNRSPAHQSQIALMILLLVLLHENPSLGFFSIKSEETDSTEKAVEELSKDKTEISKSTDIPQRCSFLVDMEDDDMDDYHMDDGDDEDEFEDIENEDENDPEELYEPMPVS